MRRAFAGTRVMYPGAAGLLTAGILATCVLTTGCRGCQGCQEWLDMPSPEATLSSPALPANGLASATLSVESKRSGVFVWFDPFVNAEVRLSIESGEDLVRLGPVVRTPSRWRQDILAGTRPGTVLLRVHIQQDETSYSFLRTLLLVEDKGDDDHDGFPNAVELLSEDDRVAFRRWFTAIAVSQARQPDSDWHIVHRDCAGLLRYAYKEALKTHDETWLEQRGFLALLPGRDVGRYSYPDVPVLGASLFRTGDQENPYGPNATGRVLRDENAVFISRKLDAAQNGDLLFFEHEGEAGPVIHSMILILSDQAEDPLASAAVVYHTGPEGLGLQVPDGSGEVRHLALADLFRHPDPSWHPRPDNPSFSGLYRWRILN